MKKRLVAPSGPDCARRKAHGVIERASTGCQKTLREFALWLENVRGLKPISIAQRLLFARLFLEKIEDGGDAEAALSRLAPADVEAFFVGCGARYRIATRASIRGALRRLLQFAAAQGIVCPELAESVPSIFVRRLQAVPRGIAAKDIERLLTSLRPETPGKSRDRAILILLATYGVRTGQIQSLRLNDFDWRRHRVIFRSHKGCKPVLQTLTPAVAEAVALYVREHRPVSDFHEVFLMVRRPLLPLTSSAVRSTVRLRLKQAGVDAHPLSPHAFRHAFASRLVNERQPFKVVADLLGHRNLRATAIYAKVNRSLLEEAAAEWPEAHQ